LRGERINNTRVERGEKRREREREKEGRKKIKSLKELMTKGGVKMFLDERKNEKRFEKNLKCIKM